MNRIFRNSLFSLGSSSVSLPVYFLLLPYVLAKIGKEGYGLWALTGVIASYQIFVDFGLTATLIRFVAKEGINRNHKSVNEYLATSLVIFFVLWLIAYVILVIFSRPIAEHVLRVKQQADTAIFLIKISGFCVIVNLIAGLFKSVFDGAQRMEISNSLVTIQILISALGTFCVLQMGLGLRGLGINLAVMSIVNLLAYVYMIRRIFPRVKVNPFLFRRERLKEMLGYSVNLQGSALLRMWVEPLNKILISNFFSITHVGYYEIALKLSGALTSLIRSGLMPIFPASAEMNQLSGFQKVDALRLKSIKFMFPLAIYAYVLMILAAPYFIRVWLGPEYHIVSLITIVFLMGAFVSILNTPAYVILNGIGYARDVMKATLASVAVNVTFALGLAWLFGFMGFCIGYSISMVFGFFAINYFYSKRFGQSVKMYRCYANIKVIMAIAIVLVFSFLLKQWLSLTSYLVIGVFCFFASLIYISLVYVLKIFTQEDLHALFGQ